MGVVYKATDPVHNRTVAIKMIQGSAASIFMMPVSIYYVMLTRKRE
jgi:hypothetical protein